MYVACGKICRLWQRTCPIMRARIACIHAARRMRASVKCLLACMCAAAAAAAIRNSATLQAMALAFFLLKFSIFIISVHG